MPPLLYWAAAIAGAIHVAIIVAVGIEGDASEQREQSLSNELNALTRKYEATEEEREFLMLLLSSTNSVVSLKTEILTKHEDFNPDDQMWALTQQSWYLANHILSKREVGHSLRVALFAPQGNCLVAKFSFNGVSANCLDLPKRPDPIQKRFTFDHSNPAVAVVASKTGTNQYVAFTKEADNDKAHPFRHFDALESEKMKSFAAFPLRLAGAPEPYSVLVLDCSLAGFFNFNDEELRSRLEILISTVSYRLILEQTLDSIVV